MGGGAELKTFRSPLGSMRTPDEVESDRQDDYETRHNPQVGKQVMKLFCACSLLDLGGDQ